MNFKRLIATLLIFSQTALAASTGDSAYIIGSKITAGDRQLIFQSGSSKPQIKWDNTASKIKFSNDGSTFKDIGSGSGGGGVNFIGQTTSWAATNTDDINLDTSIGNWAAFADAASALPTDLTGGSPTVTCTRSTSNPLNGAGSLVITKDAANRQGEGCSVPFNVQPSYQGKTVTITFPVQVTSGAFVSGDIQVFVYNSTKSVLITPYNLNVSPTGVTATFPTTGIDSTPANHAYRLGIYFASTSATAVTLKTDDFSVAPYQAVFGTPSTPWVSYTPTGTWTTNTTYTGQWRRIGDTMEVSFKLSLGGAPNNTALLDIYIPSGYTVDTTKLASGTDTVQSVGNAVGHIVNDYPLELRLNSTTSFRPVSGDYGGDGSGTDVVSKGISQSTPASWGSGSFIAGIARIPIVGWSSNVQMSNSATFKISSYLANGTRTTSTPTKLGEFRARYKSASSGNTFTDVAPTDLPSIADGIRIDGAFYTSAQTSGRISLWDIFIGKNKSWRDVWYKNTGRSGHVTPAYSQYNSTGAQGTRFFYDEGAGVLTVEAGLSDLSTIASRQVAMGDDGIGVNTAYYDIIVSENVLAVGLDQSQVISNQSNERIERAYVTNNGSSCSVSSQSGTWLSVARNGAGICDLTFAGGIFSAAPACLPVHQGSGSTLLCSNNAATTSTSGSVRCVSVTPTATDANFYITCMGPR